MDSVEIKTMANGYLTKQFLVRVGSRHCPSFTSQSQKLNEIYKRGKAAQASTSTGQRGLHMWRIDWVLQSNSYKHYKIKTIILGCFTHKEIQ